MKNHEPNALEAVIRELKGFDPVPTEDTRQDVWARLRTPTSLASWRTRPVPIAAAAAALLVVAIGLSSSRGTSPEAVKAPGRGRVLVEADGIVLEDGSRVVSGSILTTHGPAEIRSTRLLIYTEPGARLRLIDVPPESPRLEILAGTVEAALAPSELTKVVVQGTNVGLLGSRVEIQVGKSRTELIARSSELRVELRGRSETLAPGQSMFLKARSPVTAPAPAPSFAPAAPNAKLAPSSPLPEAAASPMPNASPRTPTIEEQLDQAHRVAASDATRAETLAREVLERKPAPAIEVRALAILADARRRNGAMAEAAALYRQVAEHPDGKPYAEEALYQAAQLLFGMRRHGEALRVLAEAQARFDTGPLAPEVHALAARIHEAKGDLDGARRALLEAMQRAERAGDQASAVRFRARLDVIGEKE